MAVFSKVQLPRCQCRWRASLTTGRLVEGRSNAALSCHRPASLASAAPFGSRQVLGVPQNRSEQLREASEGNISLPACLTGKAEVSLDQTRVAGVDERGVRRRAARKVQLKSTLRTGCWTGSYPLHESGHCQGVLPGEETGSSRLSSGCTGLRPHPQMCCVSNLEKSSDRSVAFPAHTSMRIHAGMRPTQGQHSQLGGSLNAVGCRRHRRRWELNALPQESLAESVFTLAAQAGPTVDLQTVIISAGALISISASLYFGMKVSRALSLYPDVPLQSLC